MSAIETHAIVTSIASSLSCPLMIGSTIAAELDATSTARTAGRCKPVVAARSGETTIASTLVMPNTTRPRRAAPRRRWSRSGMFVATMNIKSAKPMSARNASVGSVATMVRVPVRPKITPAAISPITTGGANLPGRSASIGPSNPMATTSARIP